MKDAYPDIENAFRIFILISVANCTAERLFSVLKIMKNYLRMREKLKFIALLTIESDFTL